MRVSMRRTLLAVGFAVLVSLMFVPHGRTSRGMVNYETRAPFFVETGRPVLFVPFLLQTAFAGVVAAMVVNINWRRWKPSRSTLKKIAVFLLIFAFLACAALWLWHDEDQRRRRAEYVAIDAQRKRETVVTTFPRATAVTNP